MKISLHMHVATLFLGCVWNKYVATFFLVSLVLSVKITSLQVITVEQIGSGLVLPTLNLKTKKSLSTLKLKNTPGLPNFLLRCSGFQFSLMSSVLPIFSLCIGFYFLHLTKEGLKVKKWNLKVSPPLSFFYFYLYKMSTTFKLIKS